MPRLIALPALALLAACQMTTTPQTTTREDRIAMGLNVISECGASECGRLNLDSQLVDDYSIVAPMTHVRTFMASYSDFNDLADISAMSQLRELHIGATQITDLSGLSNFPNLTLLHVQRLGLVSDFRPVGQLSGLTELALGGNQMGDMSFLRNLRNLRALSLDNAKMTSLDVLPRLRALEDLDLVDATLPDDISALTRIPNLKTLSISDWSLTDAQRVVLDQLEARGVTVDIAPAVIVC